MIYQINFGLQSKYMNCRKKIGEKEISARDFSLNWLSMWKMNFIFSHRLDWLTFSCLKKKYPRCLKLAECLKKRNQKDDKNKNTVQHYQYKKSFWWINSTLIKLFIKTLLAKSFTQLQLALDILVHDKIFIKHLFARTWNNIYILRS